MFKLFRKKKPEVEYIQNIDLTITPPEILVEAIIEPTTCHICGTVYQAAKEHLHGSMFDISKMRTIADCPLCGCENAVKFKKLSEDM